MLPTRFLLQVFCPQIQIQQLSVKTRRLVMMAPIQLTKNLENIYRLVYSKYIGYPVVHPKLMYTVKFSLSNNTSKIALA